MDQCLDRLGRICWDTPFEIASRVNAWIWAHFLFLASPEWDVPHHARFVLGLGLLAEYLYQTIEYHNPGNHISLEAKALALCGEVFPEFVGAGRWRRKGWRILEAELPRQICLDGVHAERSTMYHRIVAGELAELWMFCRRNGSRDTIALGETVQRMAAFQSWIDQGGGCLPLFGDSHTEDTYFRFSAPAAVAAAEGSVATELITESVDHSYWLLGADWKQGPGPSTTARRPKGGAFPDGGYFVARSTWTADADVLVWDCGPTGYHLNRKHSHADTLSFTLSIAGTPLLIDPGTGLTDELKEPLRSTRAHTTVCVDGEDQGILAARGEIFSPPRAELLLWATSEDCTVMSGRHDGYCRLREPIWHVRTIVAMHGLYWLVIDSFEGAGVHLAEQRFHVVPGASVAQRPNGSGVRISKSGISLSLHWARRRADGLGQSRVCPLRVRIEPSVAELYSGRREPSLTIAAEQRGLVPYAVALAATTAACAVEVFWADETDHAYQLIVTGADFEHQVFVRRGNGGLQTLPAGRRTDASIAILRSARQTELRDLLLMGGSEVWPQLCGCPLDAAPSEPGGVRRIVLEPASGAPS
jgi:hypothetical protein